MSIYIFIYIIMSLFGTSFVWGQSKLDAIGGYLASYHHQWHIQRGIGRIWGLVRMRGRTGELSQN
jgi:hypothetical protein